MFLTNNNKIKCPNCKNEISFEVVLEQNITDVNYKLSFLICSDCKYFLGIVPDTPKILNSIESVEDSIESVEKSVNQGMKNFGQFVDEFTKRTKE